MYVYDMRLAQLHEGLSALAEKEGSSEGYCNL